MMSADEHELEDEREFRLQEVIGAGKKLVYEYDFGDGWEHEVTVTKVRTVTKPPVPRCTAGARACPPEDCGGPPGYEHLLMVLADPRHPEYAELRGWSQDFKPEQLVLANKGRDLRKEIADLKLLAAGEPDDGDAPGDTPLGLPNDLVEAVLSLEPMQRASLAALIAGSLANELVEARDTAGRIVAALQERSKKPGKRAR